MPSSHTTISPWRIVGNRLGKIHPFDPRAKGDSFLKSDYRFSSSTRHLITLITMCVLLLANSTSKAQSSRVTNLSPRTNESYAISVTSELVIVPVNVTDTSGNVVSGLTEDSFHVYDERQLQSLALFQQENTPVCVGLIVDHSGSMETTLPSVITAITAFAHSGNPKDEMFVVDFSDRVLVEPLDRKAFTNNSVELENAVEAMSTHGRTALYDAVAEGLAHLQLSDLQRKALIIVSDGGDNASRLKRSEILALARQSQVMIYSIILDGDFTKEQNPKALRQLSQDTGGVAFFPKSAQSVIDSSAQIARDLREQYVLGFVPEKRTSGNLFRKLRVKVTTPEKRKLYVRTRTGYSPANAALTGIRENIEMTSLDGGTKK
jgi:Ca-activated chloride channel family protein